jgi:NADPH-dependent 2,4-dienoyl-CoA reductase/sulfur reductase-like enzyme
MGVGGLQALVKGGTDVRNARIVVAGSGPLLVAVAIYLEESGAKVFGPFEQTPLGRYARFGLDLLIHPPKLIQAAKMARTLRKVRPGKWVTRVLGEDELAVVQLSDGQLIECDYLACAYGFVPNIELAQLASARLNGETIEVDEFGRTCVQDIYVAGEPAILGGVDTSILTGKIAGLHAAGKEDEARALFPALDRAKKFAKSLDRAFDLRPELRKLAENDTIVCRCEDVCFGDLEDQDDARSAKLQTRCGMGPCQGRICGPITRQIFGWEHNSIRPPLVPVPLGVLATSSRQTDNQ